MGKRKRIQVGSSMGREGGSPVSSGDGGTQAAQEEVTVEMLTRGSSQKEGRAGTQMPDCSSGGCRNSLCQTPGSCSRARGGEWCWGRLDLGLCHALLVRKAAHTAVNAQAIVIIDFYRAESQL